MKGNSIFLHFGLQCYLTDIKLDHVCIALQKREVVGRIQDSYAITQCEVRGLHNFSDFFFNSSSPLSVYVRLENFPLLL